MNMKRNLDDMAKRIFSEVLDAEKLHYHKGGIVVGVDEDGTLQWDYGELADIVRDYKQELYESVYAYAKVALAEERRRSFEPPD